MHSPVLLKLTFPPDAFPVNTDDKTMSQAQGGALEKAHELLGEHFDSHVIIARHKPGDDREEANISHHGGFYAALGLLARGFATYQGTDVADNDPEEL